MRETEVVNYAPPESPSTPTWASLIAGESLEQFKCRKQMTRTMLERKLRKDCSTTLHITNLEGKYLRIKKRQTGLSISEIVRQEYLTRAAELFFGERAKAKSRNSQAAIAAPAVQ